MKGSVHFIERITREKKREEIYGEAALQFLYGKSFFGKFLAFLIGRVPLFSKIYGHLQKRGCSKKKILPFIKKYQINSLEFLQPVETFASFNDFFIRKLKPEARPVTPGDGVAIIPADGRFLFYQKLDACDGFIVKGKHFHLEKLIGDENLAQRYLSGSMVIGRLCPTDYHRFHFPFDCIPDKAKLINGWLYSVNPIAVKQNLSFLSENKRKITRLKTDYFGEALFIEVGATNVGTIHESFIPFQKAKKGEEKGFFSFGGSALVLLFEQNTVIFDADLIEASQEHMETRCFMGQSMGLSSSLIF